jgi:hypothetical protein
LAEERELGRLADGQGVRSERDVPEELPGSLARVGERDLAHGAKRGPTLLHAVTGR